MASSDWTTLLKTCLTESCQEVQSIQHPDATLQERLAVIHDRSKRRIEDFAMNRATDSVDSLQQALLSDGRYIRELELEHAASVEQTREFYDEAMEALAGRILRNLLNVLGLPVIQRLVPELSISKHIDQPTSDHGPLDGGQPSPTELQPYLMGPGTHEQLRDGETSRNQYSCQSTPPITKTSVTWNTLRRKTRTTFKGRAHRALGGRNLRAAKPTTPHGGTPLSLRFTGTETIYKHSGKQKAGIRRKGKTLSKKTILTGVGGHTTCVIIYKSPVRDEWVSAGHIPEGQVLPSFDKIIADHWQHNEQAFEPILSPAGSDSSGPSTVNDAEDESDDDYYICEVSA
ncbi:hypothetical protein FSARC_5278 [Fusarium sarcochroum]|uniref:Uncharacterized protein n=1 Tax=Fusarium sarcochroum TaxID=1208366 RepID=A0A8H4TZY5_9HYPO|nr:hypothetical protein FSARC_5278 [Fusarium sarcochroum]